MDDRADNRRLLVKLLHPFGFELRDAENGKQAIEIWDQWVPHLIWMDMRMPVMNGYEAAGKIKSTVRGQATAVIALTASVFEEERSMVLSAGCDDFMRKPFRESDIFEMMTKHLGVRFVYEENEDAKVSDKGQEDTGNDDFLSQDALSELPSELLTELEQASIDGDSDRIYKAIADIRPHHADLADSLTAFADEFKFDEILERIQKPAGGI